MSKRASPFCMCVRVTCVLHVCKYMYGNFLSLVYKTVRGHPDALTLSACATGACGSETKIRLIVHAFMWYRWFSDKWMSAMKSGTMKLRKSLIKDESLGSFHCSYSRDIVRFERGKNNMGILIGMYSKQMMLSYWPVTTKPIFLHPSGKRKWRCMEGR